MNCHLNFETKVPWQNGMQFNPCLFKFLTKINQIDLMIALSLCILKCSLKESIANCNIKLHNELAIA